MAESGIFSTPPSVITIPKAWALFAPPPCPSLGSIFLLGFWSSSHPQERAVLTELMRAGAMVVLM